MPPELQATVGVVLDDNARGHCAAGADVKPAELEFGVDGIEPWEVVAIEITVVSEATSMQVDSEKLVQERDVLSLMRIVSKPLGCGEIGDAFRVTERPQGTV